MTRLDPNATARSNAAWSWAQQKRLDEMRGAVAQLNREQVLECLRACRDLAGELQARHSLLAEKALAELEAEMVAEAVLTPDALPDNVEGYAVGGIVPRTDHVIAGSDGCVFPEVRQ